VELTKGLKEVWKAEGQRDSYTVILTGHPEDCAFAFQGWMSPGSLETQSSVTQLCCWIQSP
jgi:hypothetical protein